MTKHLIAVSALALLAASGAYAAGEKLSQAECEALWLQANPSGAETISQAQAQGYVTDFTAANPDGDGTLDKAEFTKACDMGLVSGAASSGAGSGSSGAGEGPSK